MTTYSLRQKNNSLLSVTGDPAIVAAPNGLYMGLLRDEKTEKRTKLYYAGEVRIFELMTQQGPALTVKVFPIVLASGPVTLEIPIEQSMVARVNDAVDSEGFLERFNKYYEPFLDPMKQPKNIHVPQMAQNELQSILSNMNGKAPG